MLPPLSAKIKEIEPFVVMELLAKAKALEAQGRNIVHMEIGEPDFPTPKSIVEAGVKAMQDGHIKYTPAAGLPQLRQAIAEYYAYRYQVSIDPDRIMITPGASGAFLLILATLLSKNKEILISDPGYPCNRNIIRLFEGRPKLVPVTVETHFHLTAKLVRDNWGENTIGVWLASPSNPSGTIIENDALKGICQEVEKQGGVLISDEIYHGLEYGTRSASALEFTQEAFVVNSFSKYFGMTGWRMGWMIVPVSYREVLERVAQNAFISAPSLSQYAALAALSEEAFVELEERRKEFERRRDFLYDGLLDLGFSIETIPDGAFYIYADCSSITSDSYGFAWDLLEKVGVAITPGKDFGKANAHRYVRFAYTTSMSRLKEGIGRIQKYLCSAE